MNIYIINEIKLMNLLAKDSGNMMNKLSKESKSKFRLRISERNAEEIQKKPFEYHMYEYPLNIKQFTDTNNVYMESLPEELNEIINNFYEIKDPVVIHKFVENFTNIYYRYFCNFYAYAINAKRYHKYISGSKLDYCLRDHDYKDDDWYILRMPS
jgi:hypothetical protein